MQNQTAVKAGDMEWFFASNRDGGALVFWGYHNKECRLGRFSSRNPLLQS